MPPADPDARDFARLRDMYKRYMLNTVVAHWLLLRDAPSDYQVVRKETAVQIAVSSASDPHITPVDAPHAPFPTTNDLMFLDRVQHGFALGHIWGDLGTDGHPYAALASRAGKKGWGRVRSRKFASDVTTDDALESVEYVWFVDDRAIVVLSRIPLSPAKRKVRISEVLFYAPMKRTDIPPQRPELVVHTREQSQCVICCREICCCPNNIGILRGSLAEMNGRCSGGDNASSCGSVPRVKMSWEQRMRMVAHGSKSGILTIVYSTPVGKFPRITVHQDYVSKCANQDDIDYRIQQHLTELWSKLPRPADDDMQVLASDAPAAEQSALRTQPSALPPPEDCGMTFTQELSGLSPVSFTPSPQGMASHVKDAEWLETCPPQVKPRLPETPSKQRESEDNKDDCYPKPAPMFDLKNGSSPIQSSSKQDACNLSFGAGSIPNMRPPVESFPQSAPLSSVCGPEKEGVYCHCSAEDMPDPSLALILNSSRDRPSKPTTEMNSFIDPVMENPVATTPASGCSLVIPPVPRLGQTPTAGFFREDDKHEISDMSTRVRFGSQSPESGKDGVGGLSQSPLPPPQPLLPEELPSKRPRLENLPKFESAGIPIDQSWHVGFDDREKLPSWNMATAPERSLSALNRALGVARSPSPLALISNMHSSSPTPAQAAPSGNGAKLARATNHEVDFHGPFDSILPSMNEADLAPQEQKREFPTTAGPTKRLAKRDIPGAGPRNNQQGTTMSNADAPSGGSGVCCEICGIRFAKRSNKLRHIQTVHNRLKQYECDLCGTKFGLKADLGRHRFRIHESRAFCCDKCRRSFAERGQLEHHIRATHEEDSRPWECKQCSIRFGRKSSLKRHEQTVHQQARFTCRFCKKSYSQKFDAIRHERKVHGFNDKANR